MREYFDFCIHFCRLYGLATFFRSRCRRMSRHSNIKINHQPAPVEAQCMRAALTVGTAVERNELCASVYLRSGSRPWALRVSERVRTQLKRATRWESLFDPRACPLRAALVKGPGDGCRSVGRPTAPVKGTHHAPHWQLLHVLLL